MNGKLFEKPALLKQLTELLEPVSYTHLDVYKRQLLWSACFWNQIGGKI